MDSLANDVEEVASESLQSAGDAIHHSLKAYKAVTDGDIAKTAEELVSISEEGVTEVVEAAKAAIADGGDLGDVRADIVDATCAVTGELGSTLVEFAGGEAVETAVQEALEAIPGVGLCTGLWRIAWGAGYAVGGATFLASGTVVGAVGVLGGLVASPWDEGKFLRSSAEVAASHASWGASVMGQGACGAIHGTANIVGQVPGTQVVTIPVSIAAKTGAKGCKWLRST